ncbi:hypothetical protein D3C86_789070 [compost metagenome]
MRRFGNQQAVRAAHQGDILLHRLNIVRKGDARQVAQPPHRIVAVRVDDQVAREPTVDRRGRALGVHPRAQEDAARADDGVVLDHRAYNLMVAADGGIGDAVHHAQRRREAVAGDPLHVVVPHRLVAVDDADAAGVRLVPADEDIVLDQVSIAMTQDHGPARVIEDVAAIGVAPRLVRDDLDLAVGALEPVVLDHGVGGRQGVGAGAHAQGLAAVGPQVGARAKIVVVDAVTVIEPLLLVAHDDQGGADVGLAGQVIVVEAVVVTIQRHPIVRGGPIRLVVTVDHQAGDPAFDGAMLLGAAEGHHLPRRRPAVPEDQVGHHQLAARQPQIGLARQHHPARGLGRQGDRLTGPALALEQDLKVAPHPVLQDDDVARLNAA